MLRNDDSIVDCHDSAFAESRNDGNGMPFMFLFYRLPRLDFVKSRNDGVMAILLFFLDCHEATPLAMTKNGDSTQDSIESRNDGSRHRLPRIAKAILAMTSKGTIPRKKITAKISKTPLWTNTIALRGSINPCYFLCFAFLMASASGLSFSSSFGDCVVVKCGFRLCGFFAFRFCCFGGFEAEICGF